jgi:predicted negative regulator of RcsB-dependent stress response
MTRIGPYEIVAGPFVGGFGEVYRVFDRDSGDEFALKTLREAFLSTSQRVERFRREINLWIRIPVHPNVVRAIRAFNHGDRPYVLVEWISSGTLADRMGSLGPSDPVIRQMAGAAPRLEVVRQICDGMAHVHAQGLVHGDLKPSNVMMWSGASPQITDFGFARSVDEAADVIGGTTRYMAPEMSDGTAATIASDIYAAGVLFLEVLEPHGEGGFGVTEGRALARRMCDERPERRPASFLEIEQQLGGLLAAAPVPPGLPQHVGERLTWDERHVRPVLPHRDRFNRAMSDLAAGRPRDARAQLESIVAEKPDMVDARIALGSLELEDGNRDAAIAHARAAQFAQPESPQRRLAIAGLFAELGVDDEAGSLIATVEGDKGAQAKVWELRGRIAEQKGDLSDAIELYRRAVLEGGGAEARLLLASALREAGLIDESIAEYQQIGAAHRDVGLKVTLRLARLAVDLGRFDEAIRALRDALKLDLGNETRAYVYAELGYVYKEQGLFDAALASYRKSLELSPDSEAVRDGIRIVERQM